MLGQKAKLLLVYPPITKLERYSGSLGIFGGNQIPLGIYYLAAYVRQHGYEVQAIDAEARQLSEADILGEIDRGDFNVLGISSTTVAFHRALALAGAVKKAFPDLVTVIGGPHVSSQPEQTIQHEVFDFAIPYEGEETLAELLGALEGVKDPLKIRGLVLRVEGKSIVNSKRPYIANLDDLPFPAFDLIPDIRIYVPPPLGYKRRPVANVITSRGCPNRCTFCENSTFGRTLRMRGPGSIVSEIELLLSERGVQEIAFVDDTFTVLPKRIHEIFDLARSRGLRFPWSCMSRINTVNEELLRYMRDNGCWHIAFGLESGDPDILKLIRKGISLDDARQVVRTCRKLGIITKGFFMVGHPGETAQTIERTIRLALELPLDHVTVTINTPMPSSYNYEHAHEFGELADGGWDRFNYWNPVFVPFGLTREIIVRKQREFFKRFYSRPMTLLRAVRFVLRNREHLSHLTRAVSRYLGEKKKGVAAYKTAYRS